MKYAILNCWKDQNKGDLGIMFATIDELRKWDQQADIIGVSCFDMSDEDFVNNHILLRRKISEIYPAIFGSLFLKIGSRVFKNKFAKMVVAALELFRMFLFLILPKNLAYYILTPTERKTLDALSDSRMCIAKGGSVFNDSGTIRSKFSLFRLSMLYFALKKFNCPYVILGQSLGPVSNGFCTFLVNNIIEHAEKVFLRERVCLESYPNIICPFNKFALSGDIAFLLAMDVVKGSPIDSTAFNVGLIIRQVGQDEDSYLSKMNLLIASLVTGFQAKIHIFPQVSDLAEPDVRLTNKLQTQLPSSLKSFVHIYSDNYTPGELKYLYSKMTLVISARLHAAIFATGANTPTICFAYHGTKAQGVFKVLGMEDFVLKNLEIPSVLSKVGAIVNHYSKTKNDLYEAVAGSKRMAIGAIQSVVALACVDFEKH